MGKVFDYLNRKEIKKNILNFDGKDYEIKTNFNLLYFILEKQNEIQDKEKEEAERKKEFIKKHKDKSEEWINKNYKPLYNAGFDNMKMMIDFIKIAVSEKFADVVKEQPFENVELIFNVVINMVNGMDEDAAFEEALKEDKKK